MRYQNPIISGFHPDPSICRVGDDFYLVNSTFEYFPGIPVYHSKDLIHWEQIGHCLTKNSQVFLKKGAPNCIGIYAPTIRYHKGTFYCIVTNVGGGGNFYVKTKDIRGEWSDPVMLPDMPGIDPSLFFDEDGKVYYTGTDESIYLYELNLETGKPVGKKYDIWDGTGANNPEGPHLYKINGIYYLLIAEGGTELGHMATIARSKSVFGPYESCPYNPVLTNRGTGLPIKAIGHADLTDDPNGNWWAVCLGIRSVSYPFRHILGRETMLVPVVWKDGWPVMGVNGHVPEEIETDLLPGDPEHAGESDLYVTGSDMVDIFQTEKLHPSWNYIYNPIEGVVVQEKDGLALYGTEAAIGEDTEKALICRRQEHIVFCAETCLEFKPQEDMEEAGMAIYLNNCHHYEAALTMISGAHCIILRRQIGTLTAVEKVIPYQGEQVILRLTGDKDRYVFSYGTDGAFTELGSGETAYLSTETGGCFTGNYIALYASGNGRKSKAKALFRQFRYTSGVRESGCRTGEENFSGSI